MSETEIAAALLVVNGERCSPPLGEAEVRQIAASVSRYQPAEEFSSNGIDTAVGTELRELRGDTLAARRPGEGQPPSLPLLGQSGHIFIAFSHLVAAYPRTGKTELVVRLCREWIALGHEILYFTEEPEIVWQYRLGALAGDWSKLHVVFGLGAEPPRLLARAAYGPEPIVVVDAIRNLLRLNDEKDNSELARVLNPWVAMGRQKEKTPILVHHVRKGGGEHGEGIAGGHAMLGVVDAALEIVRDSHQANRRVIRSYARLVAPPELLYERTAEGEYVALGEPSEVGLEETVRRVSEAMSDEWQTTKEVAEELGDPKPSQEQVRLALTELAKANEAERDPPMSAGPARGKAHRWRASSVPTVRVTTVGTELGNVETTRSEDSDWFTQEPPINLPGTGGGP